MIPPLFLLTDAQTAVGVLSMENSIEMGALVPRWWGTDGLGGAETWAWTAISPIASWVLSCMPS